MRKIVFKDCIGPGIAIISIIVSIILGLRNKQLEDNRQQVRNIAQSIQQNYYFNGLPLDLKNKIELISAGTSHLTLDNK